LFLLHSAVIGSLQLLIAAGVMISVFLSTITDVSIREENTISSIVAPRNLDKGDPSFGVIF
jgi:hypothetical protein